MISNKFASFVVVVALALVIAGCDIIRGGGGNCVNPVAPGCQDGGGGGRQPPPGATVYSVPVPGSSQPFEWWIESLDPPKGSQLNVDQSFKSTIGCRGPGRYSYALQEEFSNGPGTEPIGMVSFASNGLISDCARGIGPVLGINGTLGSAGYPDLPYYRFSVWVEAGEDIIINTNRPPDLVVDEWIGWTTAK